MGPMIKKGAPQSFTVRPREAHPPGPKFKKGERGMWPPTPSLCEALGTPSPGAPLCVLG